MPIHLYDAQEKYTLAVWEIKEPAAFFEEKIQFTSYDKKEFEAIAHPEKKMQWLASRYLIRYLLEHILHPIHLEKNSEGSPSLSFPKNHISISHSGVFVAVLLSATNHVALDIQTASEKIEKLRSKFMSISEIAYFEKQHFENTAHETHKIWCAKECIYKAQKGSKFSLKQLDVLNYEKDFCTVNSPAEKYMVRFIFSDLYTLGYWIEKDSRH